MFDEVDIGVGVRLGVGLPGRLMGHRSSSFKKEDFKQGIQGYREMFASVHLKEKELKKLWVEFGKIDKDGGRTVSGCHCVSRVTTGCQLLLLSSSSNVPKHELQRRSTSIPTRERKTQGN